MAIPARINAVVAEQVPSKLL